MLVIFRPINTLLFHLLWRAVQVWLLCPNGALTAAAALEKFRGVGFKARRVPTSSIARKRCQDFVRTGEVFLNVLQDAFRSQANGLMVYRYTRVLNNS